MLKKQDAPRLKKFIGMVMKPNLSISDMFQVTRDIDWLAKMAIELEKPDIQVIRETSLDEPKKDLKINKKKKKK